ncbi:unnamed protein product [Cuscuta campestris]|uniref:Uncharacterized protein n=1 Tax=Cuscuta campestris TaxID=132261 RepID=A0A484MD66_9ASTE|nr:unnamed protein product [Cuscuta campestris]
MGFSRSRWCLSVETHIAASSMGGGCKLRMGWDRKQAGNAYGPNPSHSRVKMAVERAGSTDFNISRRTVSFLWRQARTQLEERRAIDVKSKMAGFHGDNSDRLDVHGFH